MVRPGPASASWAGGPNSRTPDVLPETEDRGRYLSRASRLLGEVPAGTRRSCGIITAQATIRKSLKRPNAASQRWNGTKPLALTKVLSSSGRAWKSRQCAICTCAWIW